MPILIKLRFKVLYIYIYIFFFFLAEMNSPISPNENPPYPFDETIRNWISFFFFYLE